MASHVEEAALLFVFAFLCFFFFAIGFRTRLFHLLSLAMTVSLQTRIGLVENGGAIALDLLLAWTAFLPMGRCFSVDALRVHRRVRVRPRLGAAAEDPTPKSRVRPTTEPVVSLAVLAVLLQLAVIYWFNFAHKTGVTWRTGTAVHYVLRQERIVTVLGILARRMPFAITKGLTYGTLAIEACAPFLLLTPLFPPARASARYGTTRSFVTTRFASLVPMRTTAPSWSGFSGTRSGRAIRWTPSSRSMPSSWSTPRRRRASRSPRRPGGRRS